MSSDPGASSREEPADIQRIGSRKSEPTARPAPERKRDYPYATDRHLADLTAQRDRFEAAFSEHLNEIAGILAILKDVSIEKARLEVANRSLTSELRQRGIQGMLAGAMVTIGGGFVSVVSGGLQMVMGALLISGCLLTFLISLFSLIGKVDRHGSGEH